MSHYHGRRTTGTLLTAAVAVATTVSALPEIAITKRDGELKASERARWVEKRADGDGTLETNVFDVVTWSTGGAYYANVTVGTPPQPQVVILDTGSADLYFDSANSAICQTTGEYSCRGGSFSSDDSSTYQVVDPSLAFNTSFGDGSTAVGPFGEDTVGIGDVRIENVQFGLGEELNITTGYAVGLMGLGYSYIEATDSTYPNIPEVLQATGVINSRLYSVYLNDLSDISGTILFGGIDPSKYTGDLTTLNILPDVISRGISMFITTITDLSITADGKTTDLFFGGSDGMDAYSRDDYALPVLLDTGAATWSVPSSYYDAYIAPSFPFVDEDGYCGCSHREDDINLTLTFGGKIPIQVPITDLLVPIYNATTRAPIPYTPDEDARILMIVPAEPTDYAFQPLGDAILRSVYVVFHLDNGQLSLAQAAEDNDAAAVGRSNPIPVPRGPDGIAAALSSASAGAAEGYVSAESMQTWSIAPPVTAASETGDLSITTASNTIGTATGSQAVPVSARVSGDAFAVGSGEDDDDDSESGGDGGVGDVGDSGSRESSGSISSSSSSGDSSSTSSGAAAAVKGGGALGLDWRSWWASGVVVLGVSVGMGVMV